MVLFSLIKHGADNSTELFFSFYFYSTKLHSPCAISHLLLFLCHRCSVIQPQLGHLTAEVLQHGQELGVGSHHLVASLPFHEV